MTTIISPDEIKDMGYELEAPDGNILTCGVCILLPHSCSNVLCGHLPVTDPKGIGVEPLLSVMAVKATQG